jgi:phenylacetate-CoA ligase
MTFSEAFVRYFGHRLWLAYKGNATILKWQSYFAQYQSIAPDKLELLRLKSLVAMLKHAANTTSHYRDLFNNSGFDPAGVAACADIKKLPFLTKEQLNADMDSFLSNAFPKTKLICSSTGGSSGLSLTFYRDRRVQAIRRSQDYLFNAQLGIYPGSKRAWVWGSPLDVVAVRSLKARVANFLTERAIYHYAFQAAPEQMDRFLSDLNRHRPRAIFAYPNMLAVLAQRAQASGLSLPRIENVIVTAEPLYDWQRQLFHDVFGAETSERYGSREIGTVASEYRCHNGMHIFEPTYYLEVIDERGNDVPNGQMGELVVTDLYNYAMPLIRYRTGDMVTIADAPCTCGCTWRRIVAIGGRAVDMLIRADGSRVEGLIVTNALHISKMRARVQVVQKAPTSFTVRHLDGESIPDDVRAAFRNRLSELIGAPVEITYEPVAQLQYEKSGKYRYVICECDRDAKPLGR